MSTPEWAPGSVADELEKLGDKPPKGGKGRHGQKKPKDKRENPDFEDMPGYGGIAFGKDKGQMCYGSKPAKEMEITDVKGGLALHLKMETFTENRSTKKKKKPYKGGSVDGPENGEPPAPWNVACDFKAEFKDAKVKKEVPHTAKVKKCKDCKGKGYEKCDDCDGWGKVDINHDDEYIYETTDLPDELVANVGGNVIFEEKLPMEEK
ncbi:SSUH2-like protein [Mya arenaria]|uniref:SSUH2-like protein n=1 Tax=Mya arenaria TaxID=6604 RepID=A0ABY7FY94_MYAAR|nr:SSUH2-like protein [Mya arenaria]